MIEVLNKEQMKWVKTNTQNYSWRRLAEEFELMWPNSFKPIIHENYDFKSWSQLDGMWLVDYTAENWSNYEQ